MTQKYAHLSPEHLKEATDMLSFDCFKSESNPIRFEANSFFECGERKQWIRNKKSLSKMG
jgi:hypothetical protein